MEPEEIIKVVDVWYTLDPSYNAANALHDHGVTSKEVFEAKKDFGYEGFTKWYMVFFRLRSLEEDKERVNGIRKSINVKEGDSIEGDDPAQREPSDDRDYTAAGEQWDSILPIRY